MAHVRIPLCFVWYVEFLNLATLTYLRVDKSLYNEKPHHLIYLSLFNNYNFGIMHLGTVNHFMTMTDSCQMLSSVHTGDRRDLCASVLFYIPLLREVWSSSSSYVLIAWRKSSYYAQPSPAQPNVHILHQQILLWLGCVDASSKTAHYNLRKGRSILIFVGGEKEQLLTTPGEHTIYLSGRKGFIKLALEYGTPLVPMVSVVMLCCVVRLCQVDCQSR